MEFTVGWLVRRGARHVEGATARYGLLERLSRCAEEQGVVVLAFGLARDEVRLVLSGTEHAVRNVGRGVKVGTVKAVRGRGQVLVLGRTDRHPVDDLHAAVVWAHQAPLRSGAPGPLASPWSSHRDLLGFRVAPFFNTGPVRRLVDSRQVHVDVGGRALPRVRKPPRDRPRESLGLLLRLSAAVLGVLPADRRCFRLFVHLGRARGWQTRDLARAIQVTGRRIRQLKAVPEPLVPRALQALADPRLSLVP